MKKTWLIAGVLAGALTLGACGDEDASSSEKESTAVEQAEGTEEEKLVTFLGEVIIENEEGNLNEHASKGILENLEAFVQHTDLPAEAVHEGKMFKNASTCGEGIFKVSGNLLEATEENIDGVTMTYLQLSDDVAGSVYQVYYLGEIDVYKDDVVEATGVINGTYTSESVEGVTTEYPVMTANKIVKR